MFKTLKNWDRDLFVWFNSLGIEDYDSFWILVTNIETWIPLFALFFFLIFYFYGWKKGALVLVVLLCTLGLTMVFTDFVKDNVQRLRPNNVIALSKVIRILQAPLNYSFFSGHSSSSFAVVTYIVLVLRSKAKWIYFAYLWPLLFVMSRLYVGVHYPSDIVVGAIVGVTFAIAGYHIAKYFVKKI